jgi:hypothetical protein
MLKHIIPSYRKSVIGAGTHPASYKMDTDFLLRGVKRPRREAEHSSIFNAKVKNDWSYTSTYLLYLNSVDSNNFIFTFEIHIRIFMKFRNGH